MIDFGNPTWVTVVANEGAPPEQVQYHGTRFTWPPGTAQPQGMETIRISGIDLYGYARNKDGWQWVLQPKPSPIVTAINTIPRPEGWANTGPTGRQVYYNTATFLLEQGVPSPVLPTGLRDLFNAARAELQAEGWTPPA